MTTILNASTTGGLVITPDTSGNIQLQYNGVAAPAFSAYSNANQSVSNNTYTKVQFQAKEFDTASAFDATTNYRFQPTVAGYYQINCSVAFAGTVTYGQTSIYKNGASYKTCWSQQSSNNYGQTLSSIIYLNGSTDYIEIYGYMAASTARFAGGSSDTTFVNGILLRGA